LRGEEFPALTDESVFRLLVTGGSQGASILSDVVPEGLSMLPISLRRRLQVTQQCRAEDIERVRATYAELEIPADLATYFTDMPEKLSWAHLVIARAGASTLAELTVAGRPAILIPLPSAMDDHQTANVRELVEAGGARSIPQQHFTPVELAKQMQKMALEPGALQNAAKRAWNCGRPNAARDMADLLESIGTAPLMNDPVTVKPDCLAQRAEPRWGAGMKGVATDIGTIHFIGIGGIGMSGIAEVMHNLGYRCRVRTLPKAMWSKVAQKGHQGDDRPQGRKFGRCGGGGDIDRDQARQPRGRAGAGEAHACDPPRRNAGRTDAAQVHRRGGGHAWQDDDHLDDRGAARCGRGRSHRHQRRHHQRLWLQRAAGRSTGWWSRRTRATAASCGSTAPSRSSPISIPNISIIMAISTA
jgi:UDP-N-acetylglucosamine transferase subunit ALG13